MKELSHLNTAKTRKIIIFIVLLVASSYFFGTVCHRVSGIGDGIFAFNAGNLRLFIELFVSIGILVITAGLVAVLLRPFWTCIIAFALSSLTIFLAWQISTASTVAVVLYFLVSLLFCRGVSKGLEERIKFSPRAISENKTILFLILIVAITTSFYLGYSKQLDQRGFSIPSFVTQIAVRIQNPEPDAKDEFIAKFDKQVKDLIEPYERFIPIAMSFCFFVALDFVVFIIGSIPLLLLSLILYILIRLQVITVRTEMREIQRLTI
jgi:hypothetical protein